MKGGLTMFYNIAFIIVGFFLLIKGADFLVDGSSQVAKKFNIPEIIIGLTIVSIGTSLPIGNVIGSNISNLFFILGVCAAIKPLKFKDETIRLEIPLVIFLTALLYILANNGQQKIITQFEGIILMIFFVLFIIYNIYMAKRNSTNQNIDEIKNVSIINSIIKIILGIIMLKFGGDFVVDNASNIASILGISEKIISLTIVAISTSLPELITSIAVLKNDMDMAIGNVIGSNIFNIVLILGFTSIINPVIYSISYNKDIIIFLLGMIALYITPFIGESKKLSRWAGIAFVCSYISYMASLIHISLV